MMPEMLLNIPLLAKLDPAVLEQFYSENKIFLKTYPKGATVHQQHDRCTAIDIVLYGSLAAYSLSENGSIMNMFEFKKNSIIGANLLFGDQNIYPLNIYSVKPCELLHIPHNAATEFLHNHHFVMQYIRSLSMNSQGMNQKITMMAQKTLRENLLDYLKQQSLLQGSSKILLPITKKQLADYLGVQRPSLFRELKKLKDEKAIEINNHTITLLST